MLQYLVRRLMLLVPMVLIISAVVFWSIRMIPVDPLALVVGPFASPDQRELAKEKLGLDKPVYVQYVIFLKNAAHGDLGRSVRSGQTVTTLIKETLPRTLLLGVTGILFACLVAIPLGVIAAVKQNTLVDQTAMGFALIGLALPQFWLGLLLILFFALQVHWLPATGDGSWKNLILPAITFGLPSTALIARMTRSSLLEVLRQDYVRVARAKGLREWRVMYLHALRNALIPVISLLGLQIGWLVGGAVIVETVFAWPGMGQLLVNAVLNRDYPVVQGVLIILGVSVILANILADICYTLADPRVKYSRM